MGRPTRDLIQLEAAQRKKRIREFMTRTPPVPWKSILAMEGMTDRAARDIAKAIEVEFNINYFGSGASTSEQPNLPFGLTQNTQRLRANLGNLLYDLRCPRGGDELPRSAVQVLTGLNNREQIRAETKPFSHDWKMSQIERLAEALNKDPMEFLT